MGERKKISLTELDESSIVASFKEERPAQGVPPTVEPETPAPRQTEQPDIKPAHESEYLRLFIHESPVLEKHFADWQGDIEREYEQRNTGIF